MGLLHPFVVAAQFGIGVTVIEPGWVETPLVNKLSQSLAQASYPQQLPEVRKE